MKNVMIDLETMGQSPDAAIVAIGAVAFTTSRGDLMQFYRVVNLASSMAAGGQVDASTVMWWLRQDERARQALGERTVSINEALGEFSRWFGLAGGKDTLVWGNGADFDLVVLGQAYRRLAIAPPWSFRNHRCFRTLRALRPDVEYKRPVDAHNALADARSQAEHACRILEAMGVALGEQP